MSFMKTRNKVGPRDTFMGDFSQCFLVALSSVYVDSGLPIYLVVGDPLVHVSCYITFLEFQADPFFPDLAIRLFHVYPHCQSVLLFPASHPRSSGQCSSPGL